MKEKIKRHYKFIVGIIAGLILSSAVVYATNAVLSKDVVYDNSTSGLTSTNLQGAIDELNTKATTKINDAKKECPEGYKCTKQNIVVAYTYNSKSCVTGEESTCIVTSCYENNDAGSCKAGTIVKYKVNDTEEKYFYVLHDDGATLTLQQRENTVYNTAWYSEGQDSSKGPTTILPVLESATSGWTNVNNQIYTMGTTSFNNINSYTGCIGYKTCTENTYTLGQRTAKARMITLYEAAAVGCTESDKSCPIWMYNYLVSSTSYGGTVNDTQAYGYWTMSAYSYYPTNAWTASIVGGVGTTNTISTSYGARAVVVINK